VGGLFVSLICLRQRDMKSLIAYSSVAHIGLVLSGIITLNYWGLVGISYNSSSWSLFVWFILSC
jgi:NADH-ubiquinone oxidoreductase chain 4